MWIGGTRQSTPTWEHGDATTPTTSAIGHHHDRRAPTPTDDHTTTTRPAPTVALTDPAGNTTSYAYDALTAKATQDRPSAAAPTATLTAS